MKRTPLLLVLALLASMMVADAAWAHGGGRHFGHSRFRGHIGLFIGAPLFYPWYYSPPAYYYPPVVAAPAAPPVYIERGDEGAAAPPPQRYWHYCDESQAYYPYVKRCPGGWRKVLPEPPE